MSVVYEETLKKDITSRKFAPVYLLFGEDSYLKKYYRDLIAEKSFDGDRFFNLQRFQHNVELQEVFDAVNQFPIMADMKCVVLSDYDFESAGKSDFDKICSLAENGNDSCVLIIDFDAIEFDVKHSKRAQKLIKSVEKGNGKCVELKHRAIAVLAKTLVDGAAKRGCKFSDNAARHLIEISGNDLNTLRNELDKLCAFSSGREITKETVDTVCVKSVDASVYNYFALIVAKDISGALKLIDDMFFMKIEPMAILYALASSYIDMFRLFSANKSGVNRAQIVIDFTYGNRAFTLDKAAYNLKMFDRKRLELSLDVLIEADKALKSFGADSRAVLEQLTVELVYIISKGEAFDKA